MKKKIIYVSIAMIALITGIAATTTAKAERLEKRISTITNKVKGLYNDTSEQFLREGIREKDIEAVRELISAEEGTKFTEELAGKLNTAIMKLDVAKQMLKVQQSVVSLLDETGIIILDVNIDEVRVKLEGLQESKPEFVASLMETVDNASEQQNMIITTTENVNNLYNEDGTVREEVTLESVGEVKSNVEKIGQVSVREQLLARVVLVEETVIAWAEIRAEEERRIAEERRVTEERARQENNKNSSNNNNSPTNNDNSVNNKENGSNRNSAPANNKVNESSNANNSSNPSNNAASNNNATNNNKPASNSGGSNNNSNKGSSTWDNFKEGDTWTGVKTGEGQISVGHGAGNTWESYDMIKND